MKVLEVIGAPAVQTGSFERHLLALIEGGRDRGVDVSLLYPSRPDKGTHFAEQLDRVGVGVFEHPVDGVRDLGLLRWLVALIVREHFDLVHGHFEPAAWLATIAGRLARRPVVLTRHYLAPNGRRSKHGLVTAAAGRSAARFVAVSEPVRQGLLTFGVPESRAITIPLGVDRAVFRPQAAGCRDVARQRFGIAPPTMVIVATSHHRPGKGIDVLVDAAAGMPGVEVMIAGHGPLTEDLRRRAAQLAAPVRFLGQVDDVGALLGIADVFCLPTVDYPEGLPMAVMEAMAAGVAVVATPVPAVVDLVACDPPAGILVEAGNSEALAHAFRELSSDPARRDELALAGRLRAEEFDVVGMANRMINLYATLTRPWFDSDRRAVSRGRVAG